MRNLFLRTATALGVTGVLLVAGTAIAAGPAAAAAIQVTNVDLSWSLNDESNYSSMQPGAYNFLSAGIVPKTSASDLVTESEWKQVDGDVEVQKEQADGSFKAATWTGLTTNVAGEALKAGYVADYNGPSGNRISLHHGTGTLDAANDNATISWDGSFSVIYYSGLTQWYAKDLKLVIEGSTGWLTATIGGYGTSMEDATKFVTLEEQTNVRLAPLSNVDVTELGLTSTPDYPLQTIDGNRVKSWPADFVAFQNLTGQSSYWYSSGGTADPRKTPEAISVKVVTDAEPTLIPTVTVANATDGLEVEWTGKNLPAGEIFDVFIVPGGTDLSTRPANTVLLTSTWIGNADANGNAIGDSAVPVPYAKLTAGGSYILVAWSNAYLSKTKGLFASAPVVLTDEQQGALFPVAPTLTSSPQDATAFAGRSAAFTAAAAGAPTPTVHWEKATAGSEVWTPIDGATSTTLTLPSVAASDEGLQVRAVFSNATGTVTTDAATLTVKAPAAPVAPEAPVVSVSSQDVTVTWDTPDDGGSDITSFLVTLTSGTGTVLTRTADADTTSTTFVAVPAGTWTATVAASNAVGSSPASPASPGSAVTAPPIQQAIATTVTAPAASQVYGKTARLAITVGKATSGTVSVTVGAKTVTASISATGKASVILPAKALSPGTRAVTVRYAGVAGRFKPSTGTVKVSVTKAAATVKIAAKKSVTRGKTLKVTVTVTSTGVVPGGKVRVKVGAKTKTAKLSEKGRATVKVKIAKSTKAGKKKLTVTYTGSSYVAKKSAASKVRVAR